MEDHISAAEGHRAGACPFCSLDPTRILMEDQHAIAVRDKYPVSEGHTLVIPRRHLQSIFDLEAIEQAALWSMVTELRSFLIRQFAPDGFNVAVNDGEAAGQTVDHAHAHVIPRYKGDQPDPRGGVRNVIPERALC
jgi:diadenosine tetraphosphate (Ap4A) HIT family hydrolase